MNFARFGKAPFTLVMHKHEEHTDKIMDVIRPHGGTVVFDDPYVAEEMSGPMATVYDRMMKSQ